MSSIAKEKIISAIICSFPYMYMNAYRKYNSNNNGNIVWNIFLKQFQA